MMQSKSLDVLSPLFKEFKYLEQIDLSNNSVADVTHRMASPIYSGISGQSGSAQSGEKQRERFQGILRWGRMEDIEGA